MPTVPEGRRRVGLAPLPGVRVDPSAPAGAFQRSTFDAGPVAQAAQQLYEQHQQQVDQVAVLDADNQLSQITTDLTRQALSRRGVDALGAKQEAEDGWNKATSDIEANLGGSPRAKEAFRQRAAARYQNLYATVERHADSEFKQHDDAVATEGINQRYNSALTAATPEQRDLAFAEIKAIITQHAQRNGESDLAPARIATAVSRTHAGILEAMVNGGQDLAAKDYLAQHRAELVGKDLIGAEHLLRKATQLGEAQRQADRITGSALSLMAGRAEAAKIEDPEVREDTERRVRQYFADRAADERQRQAQAFNDASAIVEKTGSFDAIPIRLRIALSPTENEALQHRVDQIRHPKEPGDPETYFHLLNLASLSPTTREQFAREDLTPKGYPNLSSSERQKLMTLQRQISMRDDGVTSTHLSREAEAEQQRTDHLTEAELRKTDPAAAETLRAANFAKRQAKYHGGGAPTGAAAPAGPSATHPLEGYLTPLQQPTRAMLDDIAKKGPGYAKYLRDMGYNVP